jgi:hypothetical protein
MFLYVSSAPYLPWNLFYSFADAITRGPDGRFYFVEPAVETMTMKDLLEALDPGKWLKSSHNVTFSDTVHVR